MSETTLGREMSKEEYAAKVQNGEILGDQFTGENNVGFLPVPFAVIVVAGEAIIGIVATEVITKISSPCLPSDSN